jgi:hypothetical protein
LQGCALHEQLELSALAFFDASGDGVWSSGEAAEVRLTMSTPVDNFDYPGVVFESSDPSFVPQPMQLFGVAAATPAELIFTVPPTTLPEGTTVVFTATVLPLAGPCPDADSQSLAVVIE